MALELKTKVVQVRLTPSQVEAVRERAEQDGRPVSEWLREIVRREVATKSAA